MLIFVEQSSTIDGFCQPTPQKWKWLSALRARLRQHNLHFFSFPRRARSTAQLQLYNCLITILQSQFTSVILKIIIYKCILLASLKHRANARSCCFQKEFSNLALDGSEVDDLLVGEVGVKDFADRDNEDLAERFDASKDDFPGVTMKRLPEAGLPGVDVMITIFCDFRQFSAKKFAFFSKINVMIKILHNLALF
jgi:hypothetical protein